MQIVSCFSLCCVFFFSVELFGALRARLYDSNKNLIITTLTCISGLASAMGAAVEKSSKVHLICLPSTLKFISMPGLFKSK